ncbi:MAG: hypothetical protein WBP42_02590 [Candidatus Zixiibacteriota bacterium]
MGNQNHYNGFSNRYNPGGVGAADFQDNTKVLRGCIVGAPTTASTIATATPAHDFNVNLSAGAIAVDGVVVNVNSAADIDLSNSGSATPIVSGQSIIHCLVYWRSKGDGAVRSAWVAGTAALHAVVVRPTIAQIKTALGFSDDVVWLCVGETRLKCTGATAVSQEYNNAISPFDIPDQPMPILQG